MPCAQCALHMKLNITTGVITVSGSLDRETLPEYNLIVQVMLPALCSLLPAPPSYPSLLHPIAHAASNLHKLYPSSIPFSCYLLFSAVFPYSFLSPAPVLPYHILLPSHLLQSSLLQLHILLLALSAYSHSTTIIPPPYHHLKGNKRYFFCFSNEFS